MEEEDIKILENVIVEYSTQVEDYKYYTVPVRLDERDIEVLENLLKAYRELEKENEELKEDIKNMYSEEVVISIISDEFNLTRSEVLNLLGESEE